MIKIITFFTKLSLPLLSLYVFSGCSNYGKNADVLSSELAIAEQCRNMNITFEKDCYDLISYKNSFAQLRLGLDAQYRGLFDESLKRYTTAKEQGNFYAISLIADLYSNGLGVDMDDKKAVNLLKSTKDIDPIAAYKISYFYFSQGNYVDGVKYLTLAGENGVKTAQNELSILYSNGQYIEPDLEKSEFWTLQYQENNDDFMKRIYGR